jgi:hypothetical protein
MDFLTQQFIAFARQLRIGIGRLQDAVQKQTETIERATQARHQEQQPPPQIHAELYIPEAIESARGKQEKQNYRLQVASIIVSGIAALATIGAFAAAAYYAHIASGQLEQMKIATKAAQKTNADAWALADRANQTAVNSERPWVGVAFALGPDLDANTSQAIVYFVNSGRRPAKVIFPKFGQHDYKIFPEIPPYAPRATDIKGSGIILPNGMMSNSQPFEKLTDNRIGGLSKKGEHFFVYASIRYEDVLTHTQHWTHGCWEYLPGFHNLSNGFVNCTTYNDTGDIPPEQH